MFGSFPTEGPEYGTNNSTIIVGTPKVPLEAQLPIYWVPVLKTLYNSIISVTQRPTIWVPVLLGYP